MSEQHKTLLYGKTNQTIEFYPRDAELIYFGAVASAATYSVFEAGVPDDGTAEFTGTATLDSVSTTVDAASGQSQTNRRRINLASTSGVTAWRKYLVEDDDNGRREVVTVVAIDAGNGWVDVESELAFDYSVSATFTGLRHVFTVDGTFIADSGKINDEGEPYRVRWSYSLGGVDRVHVTTFDVARKQFEHGVNFDDLRSVLPDAAAYRSIDGEGHRFTRELSEAERQVQLDLRIGGKDPDAMLDPLVRDALVLKAWVWNLAKAGITPAGWDVQSWEERSAREYFSVMQRSLTMSSVTVVDDEGGVRRAPDRHDLRR